MEKLLSIQDVSEITGLSVGTLYHFLSQRKIPVVRISSRCVRFRKTDIEQWLAEKVVAPRDPLCSVTSKRGRKRAEEHDGVGPRVARNYTEEREKS